MQKESQGHNDKRMSEDFFIKYVPLTLFVTFACERELETEQKLQYFDPHSYGRRRCVFLVLQVPKGPLCWVMAFFTASYQQLLWTPTYQGPRGPLRPGVAFPTTLISNLTPTATVWLLSCLSYIIVQRPLNRPLHPWNGMFDRHQAEITVMQFTSHSLPVHHSEVGHSPCPILSAELTCTISSHNCHWNVSLFSGASLWIAFLAGLKVKIQQIQLVYSKHSRHD